MHLVIHTGLDRLQQSGLAIEAAPDCSSRPLLLESGEPANPSHLLKESIEQACAQHVHVSGGPEVPCRLQKDLTSFRRSAHDECKGTPMRVTPLRMPRPLTRPLLGKSTSTVRL